MNVFEETCFKWVACFEDKILISTRHGILLARGGVVVSHGGMAGNFPICQPTAFVNPEGIAVDEANGVIYVADENGIQVWDAPSSLERGNEYVGNGTMGELKNPCGLALDGRSLYVADKGNQRVVVLDVGSKEVVRSFENLYAPHSVAVFDEYLLVGERGRLLVFSKEGGEPKLVLHCDARCLAVDSASGNVFVGHGLTMRIRGGAFEVYHVVSTLCDMKSFAWLNGTLWTVLSHQIYGSLDVKKKNVKGNAEYIYRERL